MFGRIYISADENLFHFKAYLISSPTSCFLSFCSCKIEGYLKLENVIFRTEKFLRGSLAIEKVKHEKPINRKKDKSWSKGFPVNFLSKKESFKLHLSGRYA